MLKAGQFAPDFELADVGANRHTLAALLRDGPVLLAFFKSSCPVCQMTLPYLDRLAAAGGIRVFGVSQDYTSTTLDFLVHFELHFPTLVDEAAEGFVVSNGFGLTHVPSMFVVERDNSISWASDGFLKRDLEALGKRFGFTMFGPQDKVPEWKPG